MEQLSLFNIEMTFEDFEIVKKEKLVTTLKREVKRRIYDPEMIERRLKESIGTLYLHRVKLKEITGGWSKYYIYLLDRIYKVFFKDLVESLSSLNYEEAFKWIEDLLSDDEVMVKLHVEAGIHTGMVEGFAFNIEVKSDEFSSFILTGSKYRNKKNHFSRRYFTRDKDNTMRTVGDVTMIFSELLLMKEMRHYFKKEENQEAYKSFLKSVFVRNDVMNIDLEIMSKEPVIMDSLLEMASLGSLKIKEVSSKEFRLAIKGYFDQIRPAELRMCLTEYSESNIHYGASRTYLYHSLARIMMSEVVPRIHEVEVHMKQLKKSSGDYAATYEIKKNIPLKVQERMKNSPLNDYFAEVEYDELVELDNVSTFEREIMSFIKTFKVPVPSSAVFKVRRLGKIKAAGVFFPLHNTLAVDINHPNSFIHEFWHMIDYYMMYNKDEFTGQRLSSRRDFEPIIKEYKRVVMDCVIALPFDSQVKKAFFGKTKYNREYYFENTEIFARSAEIYFKNALNGKSSLVEDKENVYYPNNEKLIAMIENYFTNLLKEVTHENTHAA